MERKYAIRYPGMLSHKSEGYQRYPKLLDIEREVVSILHGISTEQAVDIALAAAQEMPSSNPEDSSIPAVVIFSREGDNPENIWRKLLKVLKTPDYDTPSYNPQVRPLVDALKGTLFKSGYSEHALGAIASLHVIRVAGGDPAAINWLYRDEARRYPQYAETWFETLKAQFEGEVVLKEAGSQTEQELFSILSRNKEIARRHETEHNRRLPGEATPSYIARQLEEAEQIFNIGNVEDLARAAALMDRVFRDYRRETYALRGIPREY